MKKFVVERNLSGAGNLTEDEEMVPEHARKASFPVHTISEVKAIIDPLTGSGQEKNHANPGVPK